jgi:hypothetical protein
MEVRPVSLKEIVFLTSLSDCHNTRLLRGLPLGEEESTSRFFLPQVGLTSILQKSKSHPPL